MINLFKKKRIYLDNAATTPVDKRVKKIIDEYGRKNFGNPGSIHKEGVEAKNALENARKKVAGFFMCSPDEVVFTSGGTESNNLAITGFFNALESFGTPGSKWHAVTTKIEHASVLDVFRELEKNGLDVTYLGVDKNGAVDPKEVKGAMRENTAMVSVMYANNETGVIQPIREIAKIIREHNKNLSSGNPSVVFHTDAAQALNYLEMDTRKLHTDLISASGSKIYGPKGAGMLYIKKGTPIEHILYGGKQERGFRAGTENVAGIVGCGEAVKIAAEIKEKEIVRMEELREYFVEKIKKEFPKAVFNGAGEILLNMVNVSFPGIESEELILRLDAKGIAVASRSACESDKDASYVISALGEGHYPENAIRFSMGRNTTKKDLNYVIKCLHNIFKLIK
ncbi:cysteine desulfurase family protein [Patescibacteria group bacterium]